MAYYLECGIHNHPLCLVIWLVYVLLLFGIHSNYSNFFCRSAATYKLKHRIRVSELWLSNCVDDVCESRPVDKSFVIGWPTTNCVFTFRCVSCTIFVLLLRYFVGIFTCGFPFIFIDNCCFLMLGVTPLLRYSYFVAVALVCFYIVKLLSLPSRR